MRAACPIYLIFFDLIILIVVDEGVKIMKPLIMHLPVISSSLGANILLSVLLSDTFSVSLPQYDGPSFTPIEKRT
jgi:hypothetical protein